MAFKYRDLRNHVISKAKYEQLWNETLLRLCEWAEQQGVRVVALR